MDLVLIAKQILAYSNWMNKARSKIENMLLTERNMFFHNYL